MVEIKRAQLNQYPYRLVIPTRWMDNDIYGHVNNVVYYSYYDTVVQSYLMENDVLDPIDGDVIGLVVETQCNYFAPLSFPDRVTAGLSATHIGNSSVRYHIGIFRNEEEQAAAQGHFVHVYVDKDTRRPVSLPDAMRQALEKISD